VSKGRTQKRRPRVLIVDDAEDNRAIYAEYLAFTQRFDVETAVDGVDALEKVGVRAPDIVLMDLSLPRLDGWETTRRLRADPKTAHICVIALTGHGEAQYVDKARAVGVDEVLIKPVLPQEVVKEIDRHYAASLHRSSE
jgi:CheY-like chemotaxis protein